MTHALELTDVSKRYVGHLAVDRLSLSVPKGTIYGILGPNGAGKSTTLRMVMNIIARDTGHVSLLGVDSVNTPDDVRVAVWERLAGDLRPNRLDESITREIALAI